MIISHHCYKRAKERLGLNSKAFDRMIPKVLEKGIKHGQTSGNMHKWVTSIVMRKKYKARVYLYSDFMLICNGENISTVYKIPNNLLPINKTNKHKEKNTCQNKLAAKVKRNEYLDFLDNEEICNHIEIML